MSEHTKGEWKYQLITSGLDDKYNYLRIYPIEHSKDTISTIRLYGIPHKKREEHRANAEHICQAHNSFDGLLEACKEGLEWIYPVTDTLAEEKEREKVIKRIQKAIAQAEMK